VRCKTCVWKYYTWCRCSEQVGRTTISVRKIVITLIVSDAEGASAARYSYLEFWQYYTYYIFECTHTHIYIFTRRAVGAQKFIRDLCVLPVARALLTYCLFAWTSAIYQKLLIVSAAVASVAPSNFIPENRHPKTTTSCATLPIHNII